MGMAGLGHRNLQSLGSDLPIDLLDSAKLASHGAATCVAAEAAGFSLRPGRRWDAQNGDGSGGGGDGAAAEQSEGMT